MRKRLERIVPARSARHHRPTGHRLVPMERLGLHAEEGDDDDQTLREAAQHSPTEQLLGASRITSDFIQHFAVHSLSRTKALNTERSLNYLFRLSSSIVHYSSLHAHPSFPLDASTFGRFILLPQHHPNILH